MKIIGIDSSGLVAGVAVLDGDILLGEELTNFKKTHSETLLPMLEHLTKRLEIDLTQIDAIAISSGPGSFTGLRIGSATAKGLGLALDKPIVEVPTLEGLAYNLWGTDKLVCPLMDARRNQVYAAAYEYDAEGNLQSMIEQRSVELDRFLEELLGLNREVIFLGDGVPVYERTIRAALDGKLQYSFAPAHMNRQRASSVAALGAKYAAEGKLISSDLHAPEYLRVSQAEREGAKHFEI